MRYEQVGVGVWIVVRYGQVGVVRMRVLHETCSDECGL